MALRDIVFCAFQIVGNCALGHLGPFFVLCFLWPRAENDAAALILCIQFASIESYNRHHGNFLTRLRCFLADSIPDFLGGKKVRGISNLVTIVEKQDSRPSLLKNMKNPLLCLLSSTKE